MGKTYKHSLFIFRRDLRLEDNTGLLAALAQSERVSPVFFFDPRQTDAKKNPYFSTNAFQFLLESLTDLSQQLSQKHGTLSLIHGIASEMLPSFGVDAVFVNADYTPFSIKRDREMARVCNMHNIAFHSLDDALLHPPGTVLKDDGKPYTVFTPFFHKAKKQLINTPKTHTYTNYSQRALHGSQKQLLQTMLKEKNPHIRVHGGTTEAKTLLKNIPTLTAYKQDRNFPIRDATTHLSAHNKFGTISPRSLYWHIEQTLGKEHPLLMELHWRDFFTHIAYYFPHVFHGAFRESYNAIPWNKSKTQFQAWCEGKTGFPIVDAGMRELNTTGYMHNRVRMITASYLVKDLHIDWRWGETYFASKLTDYDPAVNNGNWQWAASTGCDAQPYFRIFNPWNQIKQWDPACEYIHRWIPELADLSPKEILNLQKTRPDGLVYPAPMVDHTQAAKQANALFKSVG